MRLIAVSATLAAALLAGCSQPAPPPAQTAAAGPALPPMAPNTQFVGAGSQQNPPGCPKLQWNIAPGPTPGTAVGLVFFSDVSGVGLLNATISPSGQISGTVKSAYGTGPDGTLSGTRTANGVQVQLSGSGCSNVAVTVPASSASPLGAGR